MPTTKRARRHARNDEHQRQYFLYGDVFGATDSEPLFTSPEEEKRAWFLVRDEIMRECRAQCGAGRRPQGFYRHELGILAGWRWYEEIEVLLHHGLIDATEAVGIEASHQMLSPSQSEAFCSSFDLDRVAQMHLGDYMRRSLAEEFTVAAEWHAWRNRPGLAQRYRARAECIRSL